MNSFYINRDLAVAVVNDDYSGLEESDIIMLNDWLLQFKDCYMMIEEFFVNVTHCEISGLYVGESICQISMNKRMF